jgi:hypothetical protein
VCYAQQGTEDFKITNVVATYFPAAAGQPDQTFVDVTFSQPLDFSHTEDFDLSNITITALPNTTLTPAAAERRPGSRKQVRVPFSGTVPATVTQAQICFQKINYMASAQSSSLANNVCGTGLVVNRSNVVAQKKKVLGDLQKVPKTSSDKNIFASGFVTTTSDGSQGGADINLNSPQLGIPGLTVSMQLKKTSTVKGDPRNFEAAFNYRSTFLYKRKDYDDIATRLNEARTAADAHSQDTALDQVNQKMSKIQSHFLAATLLDFSGRLEGQATNFNVTNFIGEGAVQLQSRTRLFFGSRHGFWRFRILPAGFEGGTNLGRGDLQAKSTTTGTTSPDVHWISRFKSGAVFTTFYQNDESALPFKHLDLDVQVVDRHLFFQEVAFDQSTMKSTAVTKGDKPYFQADAKVFLFETPSSRYGFKLSYNRGSLPPEYNSVSSFQFGFVIETTDGDTSKDALPSPKK